ncbi:MAG: pilus assembly protein [Rickettsiales bacterium]
MRKINILSLYKDKEGSAILEFAFVAPVFFLLFFGITEFGLFMYHKVVIEGIASKIARLSSTGVDSDPVCSSSADRIAYIKCVVEHNTDSLMDKDKIVFQTNLLSGGGTVTPDICMDGGTPSSSPSSCTTFEEINGVAGYQGLGASALTNGGEIIEVRISYPWQVKFPIMADFFGDKGVVMITASTVIKNEPFGIIN